jgi:hypothetical protein
MRKFTETQVSGQVQPGTIVRPFGGERFDVNEVRTTTYGEVIFTDFYGETLRMDDSLNVEILGHYNP